MLMKTSRTLEKSEFVPFGEPLKKGETVNKFHCRHGKGNDRLYITKNENDNILAFCHHCGKKGFHRGKDIRTLEGILKEAEQYIKKKQDEDQVTIELNKIVLPDDFDEAHSNWDLKASSWVFSELTSAQVLRYRIGYSKSLRRIIFPIFNSLTLELDGYITRRIFDDDFGPKYLIKKKVGAELFKHIISWNKTYTGQCMFVEDIISGIKCADIIDTFILFGTNYKKSISFRLKAYTDALIYLDNDNIQVKQKQSNLKHELLQFVNNVHIIENNKDPKKCSKMELYSLIDSFIENAEYDLL